MNGMNRKTSDPRKNMKIPVLMAVIMLVSARAPAVEINWYEQDGPGHADGEVRIGNLADGDLDIATPGRRLVTAVKRLGEVAVVRLSGFSGQSGTGAESGTLVVVATQGGKSARATFRLAGGLPAPAPSPASGEAGPDPAPGAAAPADRASAPTAPVEGNPPAPENVPMNPVSPPAAELLRPNPVPEGATGPESPAVASPQGGLQLAGIDPRRAGPLVCPVIAIRPGSLKSNIERLLSECGARMGDWITGGEDRKYLKDWIVREPRVLADRNRAGLHGLLELLYAEYRLQGLPSPDASAIDIYRIVNASTGEVE